VTSMSVFIYAYSFQLTLFQTYSSLKIKTTAYAMKAANITLIMAKGIYLIVVFCAVYLFGSNIEKTFLENMTKEGFWIGYVL
jgi:amino acid permease